jgi:hypothetical protein
MARLKACFAPFKGKYPSQFEADRRLGCYIISSKLLNKCVT